MTAKILASEPSAHSSEIKDSFALRFELSKQRIRDCDSLNFDNRDDKNSSKNHQVISMK